MKKGLEIKPSPLSSFGPEFFNIVAPPLLLLVAKYQVSTIANSLSDWGHRN